MKRSLILLGIMLLVVMAGACRDGSIFPIDPSTDHHQKDSTSPAVGLIPAQFIGKQWDLISFEAGNAATLVGPPLQFTLTFESASHLSGSVNCNTYSGDYATNFDGITNRISTSNIGSTKIACDPDDAAADYLNGLRTTISFRISGNLLRIYYGGGRQILNYVLHGAPLTDSSTTKMLTINEMVGTNWALASLEHLSAASNLPPTLEIVPADQRFTLQFNPSATGASDGGVSGMANCNTYGASYTEGSNSLISISAPISTQAACNLQEMSMEGTYFSALEGAITYQAFMTEKGEMTLQIIYDRGRSVLNFVPASQAPGTQSTLNQHFGQKWGLVGYGPASGTLTNPTTYDGRTLVISFTDAQTMTGTGYCSTFTSKYALQGSSGLSMLNLNWPTTTTCQESEAFMVEALNTMSSYVVGDNTLQIYYHGKNDMLYFVRQ